MENIVEVKEMQEVARKEEEAYMAKVDEEDDNYGDRKNEEDEDRLQDIEDATLPEYEPQD